MSLDPRIASALASVRRANTAADFVQHHDFVADETEIEKQMSTLRIELSVAAGKLAQIVDDAGQSRATEGSFTR